ncbi:hypothetical protein ACXITP_03380 [Actinotignum sanguinis]|uniref:Uncharacterized protein n=2 Tax=Actinomycetaceae TaxID=2049 RepID=A0ABZ0RCP0_9ACTO|nr:hypothetical protein [Actinotignum sanguinis]WPJ88742.1 hypothetical protein R0V15_07725 [Schaalia turicensis]MDE1656848.1 hypothetical protein [Actinotignum sanguinis]MDK8513193.1 hypothetical protein [Actinotignum sanguinis]MDK8519828.1 hypothetical protein [Actinotignum sanguinis]MDK8656396.1 hypothetical protein [Actinotignum sanguinis]
MWWRIFPEGMWGGILIFLAANLKQGEWTDIPVVLETVLLVLLALWSFSWRRREGLTEILHAGFYMASAIALLVIQNSSWTQFAVVILVVGYMVGYKYRRENLAIGREN